LSLAEGTGSSDGLWLGIVLAVVGAILVIGLIAFSRYLRISLRLFLDTKMPTSPDFGATARFEGEVLQFPSRDGTGLMGALANPPPGVPVRGTVVFAHEFAGQRDLAVRHVGGLAELGFRIFTFDFRGHGESSNRGSYHPTHWVTNHEVDDLLAAVAYVESIADRDDHPVAVIGVSRGACAAVLAALQQRRIRALVLDGVFSTDLMVEDLMRRWAIIFAPTRLANPAHPPAAWATLRALTILYAELTARVRYPLVRKALTRLADVPTLFIYGQDDAYVRKPQRTELYRVKPGPKQLWEAPGARHNQAAAVAPEEYRRQVCSFLDKNMPPAVAEGAPHAA
jgi:pimeloyl-ACP methyl ester carboxylesterase